jgi:hypothetical protein
MQQPNPEMVFQLFNQARDARMAAFDFARDGREGTGFNDSHECSKGVEHVHDCNSFGGKVHDCRSGLSATLNPLIDRHRTCARPGRLNCVRRDMPVANTGRLAAVE